MAALLPLTISVAVELPGNNDNDSNVVFIKRQYQNETNVPYVYFSLAHKRWSEYACDIRENEQPTYFPGT